MQKHKHIILSCVYRTPGSDIHRFYEYMNQLLTYANPSKTKFVCGQGLYHLIVRPSQITINSCTLIDNIFTNQINYVADSGLLITDISDHLLIFVLCKYKLEKIILRRLEM